MCMIWEFITFAGFLVNRLLWRFLPSPHVLLNEAETVHVPGMTMHKLVGQMYEVHAVMGDVEHQVAKPWHFPCREAKREGSSMELGLCGAVLTAFV